MHYMMNCLIRKIKVNRGNIWKSQTIFAHIFDREKASVVRKCRWDEQLLSELLDGDFDERSEEPTCSYRFYLWIMNPYWLCQKLIRGSYRVFRLASDRSRPLIGSALILQCDVSLVEFAPAYRPMIITWPERSSLPGISNACDMSMFSALILHSAAGWHAVYNPPKIMDWSC